MVKPKYPIEQYKYCSKCKLKFTEDNKAWCVNRHRQPAPLQYCRDFMNKEEKTKCQDCGKKVEFGLDLCNSCFMKRYKKAKPHLFQKETVNKELYDLIKGMEKIREISNFLSYICI